MKKRIIQIIDWFYFPFLRKYIPKELFRYAFCGAANLLFDWILYFVCYHYIFDKVNWDIGIFVFSPHIASKLVSSPIATLTGFWLQKNITFQASPLRNMTQFFRYLMVYGVNLLINIVLIKLLVEQFGFWATPANMAVTLVTVAFSFLMQKYFTFWRPRKQ